MVLDCIDFWSLLSFLLLHVLLLRAVDCSKAVLLLWIFYVLSCLVFAMFCVRLFICALWSPAGKGLTSWLSFVVSTVSLSLSHWYLGSGVVLDCIDSWSLHPYLLWLYGIPNHMDMTYLQGEKGLFSLWHLPPDSRFCVCRYKTWSQELEVRSLNHPYSLKTKSSQCHYVMTPWAFGFEAI